MTAACGLYAKLRLPEPWLPATKPIALVIYGASSAVVRLHLHTDPARTPTNNLQGYYTIQLAKRSNIHPLICIAGRAQSHVEPLLDRSKGDTIIDYRTSDSEIVSNLQSALHGAKLEYAYDAVSEHNSY